MKNKFLNEHEQKLLTTLKALLNDEESLHDMWAGGIPRKEEYYKNKYGLTEQELANIDIAVYGILRSKAITFDRQ